MKQTKRIYEAPAMQVVELKSRQALLAGSAAEASRFENGGDIWEDENYNE